MIHSLFAMHFTGFQEWFLILFAPSVISLLTVCLFWSILKKAGHSSGLAVVAIFPILGISLLFYLAFFPWPALAQFPPKAPK